MPSQELAEARRIAVDLGLPVDDLDGYPETFECYLISMRIRGHVSRLNKEIREHELAMVRNATLAAA